VILHVSKSFQRLSTLFAWSRSTVLLQDPQDITLIPSEFALHVLTNVTIIGVFREAWRESRPFLSRH